VIKLFGDNNFLTTRMLMSVQHAFAFVLMLFKNNHDMLIYLHQKYFFFLDFDPELPASMYFVLLLRNKLLTCNFFVKQMSKQ